MSVLEIWGAEYQENDCLLIKPDARPLLEAICERERCSMQVCSRVVGAGQQWVCVVPESPRCCSVGWEFGGKHAGEHPPALGCAGHLMPHLNT